MKQRRPELATAICIYEGLAGLSTLGRYAVSQWFFYAIEPGGHRFMIYTTTAMLNILAALLSFGIVITLWKMGREAFFLVLLKLILMLFTTASLAYVLLSGNTHLSPWLVRNPREALLFWLPRIFDVGFLFITLAIAIYTYRLTIATASSTRPPFGANS